MPHAMIPRTFILDNTRLLSPPLVPEVRLHLAEESLPIWQKSEEELGQMNVAPPFWAFAWAGGQAVSRYLLDNRHVAEGHAVLDLGAGSGLGAIAAMLAGARSALAADIDAIAVEAIRLNAVLNGVPVEASGADLLAAPPGRFDLVLIGDLFYEKPLAEKVLAFAMAAKAQGADVLVGDPRRSYFPKEKFSAVADYEVPVTRDLEDAEIKRSAVWRLA